MPKERIYGRPGDDSTVDNDVSIQWEKAQPHRELDDDGYGGYVSISLVPRTTDAPHAAAYLDRTALNKLVAVARRARGAAYGADE